MTGGAGASPQYTALGSAFTFQGSLVDGGVPANGTYDFTFDLFDDAVSGISVSSTVTKDEVTVTDGRFTVLLDLEASSMARHSGWRSPSGRVSALAHTPRSTRGNR